MKNKIDAMVRDFTQVTPRPKSLVRERIMELLEDQKEEFRKLVEGMSSTIHTPVGGLSNKEWIGKQDLLNKIETL